MKKVIGILVLVLLGTTVFGQDYIGDKSFIEESNDWTDFSHFAHFNTEIRFSNGELRHKFFYMLAYEPNFATGISIGMKRKVYLYCIEITPYEKYEPPRHWIRVSDEVFEGYVTDNPNGMSNVRDFNFIRYDKETSNLSTSSVEVGENAWTVTFTIGVIEVKDSKTKCYQETVKLKAVTDSFDGMYYKVIR